MNNVVALHPLRTDFATTALANLERLVRPALSDAFSETMKACDDALFERAERATNGNLQNQYFDDLRALRVATAKLCQRFESACDALFRNFADSRIQTRQAAASGELSLVAESDLELDLALLRVAARIDDAAPRQAHQVRLRLFSAFERPEGSLTPMCGTAIAEAVRQSLVEVELSIEARLILLKRLERSFYEIFPDLIDTANRALQDAGLLPDLRYGAARLPALASRAPTQPTDRETLGSDLTGMVTELNQLLAPSDPGRSASRPATGSDPGTMEIDSVSALRKIEAMFGVDTPQQTFSDSVRGKLLESDLPSRLSKNVDAAINLVDMMFDYVARDQSIAQPMQRQLSRLKLPMLKQALSGDSLFRDEQHPLRVLMETLVDVGRTHGDRGADNPEFLGQIESVVDRLQASRFDSTAPEFNGALDEIQNYVRNERRRAEIATRRAAEAARAHDLRLAAERSALTVIDNAMSMVKVPPPIEEVVRGPLRRHLETIYARRGEQSSDWKIARKLVHDIAWSLDPETLRYERAHWSAVIPNIVESLRGALAAAGIDDDGIDQVVVGFRDRYEHLLAGIDEPQTPAEPTSEAVNEESKLSDGPSSMELQSTPPGTLESSMSYSEALMTVRRLAVGQWFEILAEDGRPMPAKLVWTSALTERCLFVNGSGRLVADRAHSRLATDIMAGTLRELDHAPMMQRALQDVRRRALSPDQHP